MDTITETETDERPMSHRPQLRQNRVRDVRERAGLKLSDLSERTGISVQMLSRLERGERALTDRTLTLIATALKVKKAYLLDEVDLEGGAPTTGDFVEDPVEAMVLRFWRMLSLDARDHVISEMTSWARARISPTDARGPVAVNES